MHTRTPSLPPSADSPRNQPAIVAGAYHPIYIDRTSPPASSATLSDRIAERQLEEPERWDGMS